MSIINSQTDILSNMSIIILVIYLTLFNIQTLSTNFIIMDNLYPMLTSYLISGIMTILIEILFIILFPGLKVNAILLAQLLVLVAYNAWKWPIEVAKSQNKTIKSFLLDCLPI